MKRLALAAAFAGALLFGASCRTAAPAPPAATARDCIPQAEMPDPLLWLPPPPEPGSPAMAWDLASHELAKARRSEPGRAAQAVQDAVFTWENLYAMFSPAWGGEISEERTPALCAMLRYGLESARNSNRGAKRRWNRVRPFAELGEASLLPADEHFLVRSGSYPSGHAVNGWAAALLLSELRPPAAEALLLRGLEAGESREIAGVHWRSDVDAARLVAAAAVARLHADPEFRRLLEAAAREQSRP